MMQSQDYVIGVVQGEIDPDAEEKKNDTEAA